MNTIQVTNDDGQVVNYVEAEVKDAFRLVKQYKAALESSQDENRKLRYKVRDYFGELEWSKGYDGGESTVYKDHVNELLDSIGCDKLTTSFSATVRINVTITNVDAVDEDDAREQIEDGLDVSFYQGDHDINEVEFIDVTEED